MMELRKAFQNLPPPVQNWLTSDTVTAVIIDINKRLDLEGELLRILPTVILRLVVKDIKPENFISELSKGLDLDFNQASAIARDIEEKILGKIETILRANVGIDTKLIYNAEPETPTPKVRPPALRAATAPATATPPQPPRPTPPTVTPKVSPAPLGDQSFGAAQDKPYIIYKERPELRETPRPEPPKPPPVVSRAEPEVKIPIKTPPPALPTPVGTPTEVGAKPASSVPPRPPAPPQQQSKPGEVRMVHYSNFRTPLNQ